MPITLPTVRYYLLGLYTVDLHSFFADPAVFLNADPDSAAIEMRSLI